MILGCFCIFYLPQPRTPYSPAPTPSLILIPILFLFQFFLFIRHTLSPCTLSTYTKLDDSKEGRENGSEGENARVRGRHLSSLLRALPVPKMAENKQEPCQQKKSLAIETRRGRDKEYEWGETERRQTILGLNSLNKWGSQKRDQREGHGRALWFPFSPLSTSLPEKKDVYGKKRWNRGVNIGVFGRDSPLWQIWPSRHYVEQRNSTSMYFLSSLHLPNQFIWHLLDQSVQLTVNV